MKEKPSKLTFGNIVVKIYPREQIKNGRSYKSYAVADRSSGKRKFWTYGDLEQAKLKAQDIANAISNGEANLFRSRDWRFEMRKAMESLESTGLTLLPACLLFEQAIAIVGHPRQLLGACEFWRQNRPVRPVTPKSTNEAVAEFLSDQAHRVSPKRQKTVRCYLLKVSRQFVNQPIHEIEATELRNYVNAQGWKPKTRNEFLGAVSLLFKYSQSNHWVPPEFNPAKLVEKAKAIPSAIEIFEPDEARQILDRLAVVAPELVPFMAIWLFSGIRKEEIARIYWDQISRALTTGFIELPASATKTRSSRNVPVEPNLRAWLLRYRCETGTVVPAKWLTATKSSENRLGEITRFVSRKTDVVWKNNAPRHSYGTYKFKLCQKAGDVTSAMGTSLDKFQKHYWNKSQTVTEEGAKEWFNIHPKE